MNQRDISAVKAELSSRFLGRDGIHGFSTHPGRKVIRIFAAPTEAADLRKRVIDEIARAAAPFEVEVVVADSPKFLNS